MYGIFGELRLNHSLFGSSIEEVDRFHYTKLDPLLSMWKIVEIINQTSPEQQVLLSGGGELLNVLRGPEGASYRIVVTGKGFLDLVDVGRGAASWEININGRRRASYPHLS